MSRWQEVKIVLNRTALEGANAVLERWGVTNYAVEDSALYDRARDLGWGDYVPEAEVSDEVTISCYLAQELSGKRLADLKQDLLNLVEYGFDPGSVSLSVAYVDEKDWSQAWKEHYKPLRIGRVLIQPSWLEVERRAGDEAVVLLDPGMAFGAGTHPTTALCVEILQQLNLTDKLVWDVGTGSGILAVTAAKLGAQVEAVDIDPVAVRVACENRDMNGLDFSVSQGSIGDLTGEPDIIVANIVADVIMDMLPQVSSVLKPGGFFIASGVIDSRDADVLQRSGETDLRLLRRFQRKEWIAYLFQRSD
ncbi:MAG: 50S ribosomal protein L11 methyltransferase [Firmicutes bacterium]|jgi:ribosomal protein L11 methyltransferase|nr:50S ribosomal protein L11 methyltransferase [Bacillota bacterium]NLO65256.1 50S ribosomal protein L11 methyltransferase [Bacillota bacterium]